MKLKKHTLFFRYGLIFANSYLAISTSEFLHTDIEFERGIYKRLNRRTNFFMMEKNFERLRIEACQREKIYNTYCDAINVLSVLDIAGSKNIYR